MNKFIEVTPYGGQNKPMLVNVGIIKRVYETTLMSGKRIIALKLSDGKELHVTHSYDDVVSAIYYTNTKSMVSVLAIEKLKPKEKDK